MRSGGTRAIGGVLMAGAVLGVLIGVSGLALIWVGTTTLTDKVLEATESAERALDATDDLLVVLDETLGRAETRVADIEVAVDNVAAALDDTAGSARTFGELATGDLSTVVEQTRTALDSVATTAQLVDRGLTMMAGLPFVNTSYAPEVPLNASIGGVSDALEPVPEQLALIDRELQVAADNIEAIRGDILVLTDSMGDIESSLAQSAAVVTAYRETVDDVRNGVVFVADNIELTMNMVRLLAVALFVWLIIAQLGLLTQGWGMWKSAGRTHVEPAGGSSDELT